MTGSNATASAAAAAAQNQINTFFAPGASAVANYTAQVKLLIAGYSGTTFFKTMFVDSLLFRNALVADFKVEVAGAIWLDTAAINQVEVISTSGNFATGTILTLYGLT